MHTTDADIWHTSTPGAEDARFLACLGAAGPVPPKLDLLSTDKGRQVLTSRMVAVAEQQIASNGAVTKDYLLTQFKSAEVEALWSRVLERLSLSIRDLALAA